MEARAHISKGRPHIERRHGRVLAQQIRPYASANMPAWTTSRASRSTSYERATSRPPI
jgi:hypothetical protein